MTIRVGPTEKQPTHHVKLTDRDGNSVGLILCNDKGEPAPMYNRTPIERTALKTTSGGGSYADFNYPYSPIVQDDWSGGRGNKNFEADSTRFSDSYRVNTRHSNKVFLGPQEYFSRGYRSLNYPTNSNTAVRQYAGSMFATFSAVATYTTARVWLFARSNGAASNITIYIKRTSDNVVMGSGTLLASKLDTIGQWVSVDISASLISSVSYYLEASSLTHWELLIYDTTTQYLIEPAAADDTCIYYEYKGQQYKVLSTAGAAPTVWMNGDRGAADSNAGQLTKLIDATKSWAVNVWAGCIVKIVQGTGKDEAIQYRTVASNTPTEITCTDAWVIQHDTTTEYVILGSDIWHELTGHGLTVPVTAILPVEEVVYFGQGSTTLRSHREYNNAGTWTDTDWRADGGGVTADHLAYQPLANKIWRAQNTTSTGGVGVSSATPPAYGVDLSFAAVIAVGYKYEFINGLEVYPNDSGTEALWVYKEELAYSVTTTATGIKLDEMRHLRSRDNGKANLVHNVYSYFTLGNGLQRYYGGSIDSVGPNLDEGLPTDRQGKIVQLLGYPGRVMAIVDGGTSGYSSLLERDGSGWHEVYRAPLGEKLKAMALQVIPGTTVDRLWLYQGNVSVWLPMASNGVEETKDSGYTYAPEGALILSVMHAGLFDVQKIVKKITLWAKNLLYNWDPGEGQRTIEIDYRLNNDETWTNINVTNLNTPTSTSHSRSTSTTTWAAEVVDVEPDNIAATSTFGAAGKSIQIRLRFFASSPLLSPILTAAVIDAVSRIQIKYMYNLTFRVMDDEPTLTPREMDEDSVTAASMSAITKLAQIESWADADTEGLLYMTSNSPLYNDKYIFLNPPVTRQIAADPDSTRQWTGFGFVCSTTAQEA